MMGEADAALGILSAALEETERTGEKCHDAELHRGIGEAYYQRSDIQAAEQSFRQALTIAREQGARLWELNAATSYARMLRDEGEPGQAHALLAPIYDWFSEGFDTAPLRRARVLLDELEAVDNVVGKAPNPGVGQAMRADPAMRHLRKIGDVAERLSQSEMRNRRKHTRQQA